MRKRTSYIRPKAEAGAEVPVVQIVLNGGGAVTSVNGQTGDVVLDARDVGAASAGVTINGKPLTEDVELTAADVGAVSTGDIAEREEAQEILKEVFGQGGIASTEDARQVLTGVFGQGGIAPKEDAQRILDDVFETERAAEQPTARPGNTGAGVASVSDAKRILQTIFGKQGELKNGE